MAFVGYDENKNVFFAKKMTRKCKNTYILLKKVYMFTK